MKTNNIALLIALTATALFPLGLMGISWGFASFAVWDTIPFGWVPVRIGLGLGVILSFGVVCDKNFMEIFKE
jgi:hypothetical protein